VSSSSEKQLNFVVKGQKEGAKKSQVVDQQVSKDNGNHHVAKGVFITRFQLIEGDKAAKEQHKYRWLIEELKPIVSIVLIRLAADHITNQSTWHNGLQIKSQKQVRAENWIDRKRIN